MAKKELNLEEFKSIIREEAMKLKQQSLAESKKNSPENNKKELTVSEFKNIVREEAMKLKKRMVLENEKRALEAELKELSESLGEDNIEELFGGGQKRAEALRKDFIKYSNAWKIPMSEKELNDLMAQAKEDKYRGRVANKDGKMAYRASGDQESAGGIGGHTFGSGM